MIDTGEKQKQLKDSLLSHEPDTIDTTVEESKNKKSQKATKKATKATMKALERLESSAEKGDAENEMNLLHSRSTVNHMIDKFVVSAQVVEKLDEDCIEKGNLLVKSRHPAMKAKLVDVLPILRRFEGLFKKDPPPEQSQIGS